MIIMYHTWSHARRIAMEVEEGKNQSNELFDEGREMRKNNEEMIVIIRGSTTVKEKEKISITLWCVMTITW